MKIFDRNKAVPSYIEKHGKAHEITMLLLTFVVVPLVSILVITLACKSLGITVVQTTASMLMWQKKKVAEVVIWGILNCALYVYLLKLNLDAQQYSKATKIIFYIMYALGLVTMVGGVSIPLPPSYNDNIVLHKTHNALVTFGFVMMVFVCLVFCLSTWLRNAKQGMIMTSMMCFLLMTMIWAIPQVNDPAAHTFVTVATQMYVLVMVHVTLTLNYFFSKLLPNMKFVNMEKDSTRD